MTANSSHCDLPLTIQQMIDPICDRFEAEWQAGRRPRIEEYLADIEPAVRPYLARELVKIDAVYRYRAGEAPTAADYAALAPDVSPATLAELLDEAAKTIDADGTGTVPESATPLANPHSGSAQKGDRFRPIKFHRAGGLGEVFLADDSELPRKVALKRIKPRWADDARSRARFLREAEITSRLEHPGIVPVYGLVREGDGGPEYAMRFVEGDSLHDAVRRFHADPASRFDSLAFRELLGHFVAVCNAVAFAHSRGVVHRDLKPDNVMLGQYGETYVVDWGLAKFGEPNVPGPLPAESESQRQSPGDNLTHAGHAIGTPQYMAPEQAAGDWDRVGPAADVYSLGATLFSILTGRSPVTGTDHLAILARVQAGDIETPRRLHPAVPPALDAVCRKAMALRPEDRYASAQDLAADIERWRGDEAVAAWPEPVRDRAWRWLRRHRTLTTGLAAAAAIGAVALVIGFVTYTKNQSRLTVIDALNMATVARQAGNWQGVLNQLDRATAAGHPLTPELRLDKVRAWFAINQAERARAELEAMAAAPDVGDAQGRLDLYRGIARLGLEPGPAGEMIRRASTSNLPPADKHYADALLAADSATAVRLCQEAIKEDPFHQDARGTAVVLLVLLGRLSEARILAEASAILFRQSAEFPAWLALMDALDGRIAEAQARVTRLQPLIGFDGVAGLSAVIDVVPLLRDAIERNFVEIRPYTRFEELKVAAQVMAVGARLSPHVSRFVGSNALSAPGKAPDAASVLANLRLTPLMAGDFGALANVVGTSALRGTMPKTAVTQLEALVRVNPEGTLLHLLGFLYCQDERFVKFDPEFLRKTAATFEQAESTPSIFPIRDGAKELQILAECLLCSSTAVRPENVRADPSVQPKAIEHIRERLDRGPFRIIWAVQAAALVALQADDLVLARRLLAEADATFPGNGILFDPRYKFYMKDRAYGQAIALAAEVLRAQPENADWKNRLKEAREKLKAQAQEENKAP